MTDQANQADSLLAIDCKDLSYSFVDGQETVLTDINLELEQGSRCLLVGANGGVVNGYCVQSVR